MLIIAFKTIVNKLNQESFYTIFIENLKKNLKKLIILSFSHKMFLKIVPNLMSLEYPLIFFFFIKKTIYCRLIYSITYTKSYTSIEVKKKRPVDLQYYLFQVILIYRSVKEKDLQTCSITYFKSYTSIEVLRKRPIYCFHGCACIQYDRTTNDITFIIHQIKFVTLMVAKHVRIQTRVQSWIHVRIATCLVALATRHKLHPLQKMS